MALVYIDYINMYHISHVKHHLYFLSEEKKCHLCLGKRISLLDLYKAALSSSSSCHFRSMHVSSFVCLQQSTSENMRKVDKVLQIWITVCFAAMVSDMDQPSSNRPLLLFSIYSWRSLVQYRTEFSPAQEQWSMPVYP